MSGQSTGNSTRGGSALLPLYATCPPGLAGNNCTQATCDSLYVNPASRPPKAAGQESCSTCTDGFSGVNCNVCTDVNACTRASALTGNRPTVGEGAWVTMLPDNDTFVLKSNDLTCHRQPKAITTTHMQCNLAQPTFSSLFPGNLVLTMTKVVNPDRTKWSGMPGNTNTTAPGVTLSEVWLDGELQFYCQATGCSSSNGTAIDNGTGQPATSQVSDLWHCADLKCSCIPGTKVCGGSASSSSSGFALGPVINGISGAFDVPCNYVDDLDASNATASCQFKAGQLVSLLGSAGVPLEQCRFGSCLLKDQLSHAWTYESKQGKMNDSQHISGPVAGGIAVLVVVIVALLGLLFCGMIRRHRARFRNSRPDIDPLVGLKWEHVSYSLRGRQDVNGANGAVSRLLPRALHQRPAQTPEGNDDYELKTHSLPFTSVPARKADSDSVVKGATRPKQILEGVSGTAPPGHLVAILGPSGAGKTTLVELFAGREKTGSVSGNIFLQAELDQTMTEKGKDAISDRGALQQLPATLTDSSGRRLLAFVDQDDQLPPYSTVREALLFAAELSLPENVSEQVKADGVDRVVAALGLESVQNSLIGSQARRGISGGERRRVSIGVALVARPRVLILDEPLSGLDAYNAARVVDALRSLAHKGTGATTVILTLHQPSSEIFHRFDKVIVITQGKTLYDGAPGDALAWCLDKVRPCPPGYNVADHLLDLAIHGGISTPNTTAVDRNPDGGGNATNRPAGTRSASTVSSKGSIQGRGDGGPASTGSARVATTRLTDVDIKATKAMGRQHSSTVWFTQFAALLRRHSVTAKRDRSGPIAHLLMHIVVGLVAGGSFFKVADTIGGFQNRIGSIYFLYLMMAFASMSAITHLAVWRPLMIRERANRFYSPYTWLSAHALHDLIFWRLIPGALLIVIMYTMVGLRKSARYFFEYLLVAALFYVAITIYMMILSAFCEEMSVAVLLGGAFILFNIGMGGFLLNLESLPGVVKWIQWLCPLKYALEAVAINEIENLQINDQLNNLPVSVPATLIAPGLFGLNGSYYRDLLVLALAWVPGLALVLTFAVWWRMRDRR